MARLTDHTSYADALRHFSRDALWTLFDGDRDRFNITHECLDRHAGAGTAVHVAHADGRIETLPVADLARDAARFAHFLRAEGIGPGERVAIMLDPCRAFYVAVFGTMKAGCVAVPLFTQFGPDGLRLRIGDCTPRLLVVAPDRAAVAEEAGAPRVLPGDDALFAAIAGFPDRYETTTSADDMALFQYTSGTTRELPEAVPHTHKAVVVLMLAALYGQGIRPGDRYFCPSSPAWGHGMWHGTIAPLALGATVGAWSGRYDGGVMCRAISELRIDTLAAAATHYRMIRNSGVAERYPYAVRKLSFTGEPMDSTTADYVERLFGTPACSMYGTTETGVILVNYPGAPDFEVRRGSLGKPVPGVEVAVHDAAGGDCAPGVVGQLMLKRRDRWLPTKDLGHVDADGFFYHDGRADDVIISGGYTMSAKEIEDALLRHADVLEAAAIGVADAVRGKAVKAFIVARRPGVAALAEELRVFVRTRLSRHEYPRHVEFVAELPKTPAGKVNRRVLRDREANTPAPTGERPR